MTPGVAGGEVLLAPTNASSYSTSQMPALELGAARLRAIETGRGSPAGGAHRVLSALIDPDGDGAGQGATWVPRTLAATVDLRTGRTPYSRLGDGPRGRRRRRAPVAAGPSSRNGRAAPDTAPGPRPT